MSAPFEESLRALLVPLFANVYFDTTPDGFVYYGPLCIIQQAGGSATQYVEKVKMPEHKNARMQIVVWAKTRLEAAPLARSVEDALILSPFIAVAIGAPTALYDEQMKLHGTRQFFSIWFTGA